MGSGLVGTLPLILFSLNVVLNEDLQVMALVAEEETEAMSSILNKILGVTPPLAEHTLRLTRVRSRPTVLLCATQADAIPRHEITDPP